MLKVDFDLSGVKIPKQVAGVKVPKGLRRQGKKLLAKAQTPQGREAIAAGLTIAATAIAGAAARGTKARAAPSPASRAAQSGEGAVPPEAPTPPRAPGVPGIDPNKDLGEAIAAGIGALQTFLAGKTGAK